MKKIFLITAVSAAALLGACGNTSTSKPTTPTKSHKTTPVKVKTAKSHVVLGWVNGDQLRLPYVGYATPTITTFAQQDSSFYTEVTNPKYWVKSKTFGQYIFVGPYTTGVSYQRVRDAKIGAVDAMEDDTLFVAGATTWPTHLGNFNLTTYNQTAVGNMQSVSSIERYDAAHYPGSTYTLNVPSIATIAESPVGMLTPKMMSNTPSQPQYSEPGACIPHTFAAYYKGTTNFAITGGGINIPQAVYSIQYGPTDNLGGLTVSAGWATYNRTASCNQMP